MSHSPSSSAPSSTSEASQSSHSSHSDMARSHSLKSTTASLRVPPSLRESPLLHSPYSIFKRTVPPTEAPSDDDERWLQDTIPVSTTSTWENSPSHTTADVLAIPSTPLARNHQNVHQPSIKLQEKNVIARPEPNIPRSKEQGYFDLNFSNTS